MQTATETFPNRYQACLTALCLYASQYTGGVLIGRGLREQTYEGSTYLGVQKCGRPAWKFGHQDDAQDFAQDAIRICESEPFVIDCEITWHPYRDGSAIVLASLLDEATR